MGTMKARDAELTREQQQLDLSYDRVTELLDRIDDSGAGGVDRASRRAARMSATERIAELEDALTTSDPLFFGRLDYEEGAGEEHDLSKFYIGRVHVLDKAGDELIVSWKSDVARPFYRAGRSENLGVARRRRFAGRDRLLTELSDEVLGELPPDLLPEAIWETPEDLLLAELMRHRDGQMRDIVATIQAGQDRLIRHALEEPLIIQGGPGTGKTAIGLHRASYLLFRYAESLKEDSVLVVAPTAVFLRYIAQVLPGLGDDSVQHVTVDSLGPRLTTAGADSDLARRVKASSSMATLISNYLDSRVGLTDKGETFDVGQGGMKVDAGEVNELVSQAKAATRNFSAGRQRFRASLIDRLARRSSSTADAVGSTLRSDAAFNALVDRAWPTLSARQVVADLLTGPQRLRDAAEGLLSATEIDAILQPTIERLEDMTWSPADVPLVDEAEHLLGGTTRTYQHLIIDEAQDLSMMQLRMLARRCPSKSMTILGDLAQGTAPWAPRNWDAVADQLGIEEPKVELLTTGYRVPAEIIEEANSLVPSLGVDVPLTTSVRSTGHTPTHETLDPDDLIPELIERLRVAAKHQDSTAVILPSQLYDQVADACRAARVPFGEASKNDLVHRVTLLTYELAKGLEFDHAIVIDGGTPATSPELDARHLYIAMTRAVNELTVLHVPRPVPPPEPTPEYDMPDIHGITHEVPAIRFDQDGITLYVTSLPARVIADIGVVDTWNPDLPENDGEQGYQREVVQSHAKQIARFLLDPEHNRLMPTAATLCARRPLEFTPVSHNGEAQSFGTLSLTPPIYIVDGQHRTAGFTLAAEEDEEIAAFERPVVIMEGVGKLEEIRQFQTINATAKRVRTDLADRLLKQLGEFDEPSKSWKAVAIEVSDVLNTTPKGPWVGRITMPNGNRGVATQRTMTESLKLVTTGVLRPTDVTTIAGALNNFWGALRKLMPEAFENPRDYVLQKSVGVFAFNEVAAEVFLRCFADGRDFTQEKMYSLLRGTGEYVDPTFWLSRSKGGTAPNYGGRGGFSALAHEIIAELPTGVESDSSINL